MVGPPRSWTRSLWLLVPLVGLVELVAHFVFARRAPTDAEWQAVRASVVELRREHELVVVAPRWAEPLARRALGEAMMPLRDVARPDETGYPRALELSALGASAPELDGWRVVEERSIGKLRIRLRENPAPARVLFDFVDALGPEQAQVFERTAGEIRACAWQPHARRSAGGLPGPPAFPARRFVCPEGDPFFVGATVIDDPEYRARRCIWAQPTPAGPLVVRFEKVGVGVKIRGHAGMPWLILRDVRGLPVELEVTVGGRSIGTLSHREEQGWQAFEFETGELAGRVTDVEFSIRSREARDRQFCFHADTR
jgi:hypothetical protein